MYRWDPTRLLVHRPGSLDAAYQIHDLFDGG